MHDVSWYNERFRLTKSSYEAYMVRMQTKMCLIPQRNIF